MPGFKVPEDLAYAPLTIPQVKQIIANRTRRKILQARLDGLDDRADNYRKEIEALETEEQDMLEQK